MARLPVEYYGLSAGFAVCEVRGDQYSPVDVGGLAARGKELFARMRTFGIENLHEGQTIDVDEKQLEDIRALPAIALENAAWRERTLFRI